MVIYFIKNEKKTFSLKWFSLKLFLFGIFVKANIGVIIEREIVAQSQVRVSCFTQDISKSSKTAAIQIFHNINNTQPRMVEVRNITLIL